MKAPAPKPHRSLADYAKANPARRGLVCWVCSLPPDIRKAVDKGKRDGMLLPTLIGWLVTDLGYSKNEARPQRVRAHFQAGHHQQ